MKGRKGTTPVCEVDGCPRTAHGNGLCRRHYNAWRRRGNEDEASGGCSIPDCSKMHYAKTWCYLHYARWRKHGDPLKVTLSADRRRPNRVPMADRFWPKVEKGDGCWLWRGSIGANGYGTFAVDGRRESHRHACAHRVAYELTVGPIPDGLVLDHLCNVRSCVNPAHLEPVTQAENVRRAPRPANQNTDKTHCVWGHEFTPDNTRLSPDGRHRACRKCERIRCRRSRERRRAVRELLIIATESM